jgi:hypothetical protein
MTNRHETAADECAGPRGHPTPNRLRQLKMRNSLHFINHAVNQGYSPDTGWLFGSLNDALTCSASPCVILVGL